MLLAVLALALRVPAQAATSSTTTLTTTVPGTTALVLELQGSGTVTIDGTVYNQSGTVQIQRNADIAISIIPNKDYRIKSVCWGDNDITAEVKAGNVMLPGVSEDTRLLVTFEKVPTTPETGDSFNVILLILLMALSLLGIVVTLYIHKKLATK